MDEQRFDALTREMTDGICRRRAGQGLIGLALMGMLVTGADAGSKHRHKRRHKKPRCRRLRETCTIGGERACCAGRTCSPIGLNNDPTTFCCLDNGAPCAQDRDCCGPSVCSQEFKLCFGVLSDRNAKANFSSVDPGDMLERVRMLPITAWSYRSDDASVRHIGPMAQDFAALFSVGSDDRMIHPADGQGVALAAIQALADQIIALQAEQTHLMEQIAILKASGNVGRREQL